MMQRIFLSYFGARELLLLVGEFIQDPIIADAHIKSISVKTDEICKCTRCNGKGIIDQFKYYCDGICFQCYGSKYEIVKKTVTV
jgi:Zn finger protein HypA/HybF involved in hydrogenase expression